MSTPVPEEMVADWLGVLKSTLEAYLERDDERDEKDAPSLM